MKNFSELLATEQKLTVIVNGDAMEVGLHDFLAFDADTYVYVDDIEVLPKYRHLAEHNMLTIAEPFYCWYHRVSGQGWLLMPQ